MTDATQATARVTIEDVRTAIEGIDPNATNASKVRSLLGNRGSFETIQKHLTTIRQELATASAPPVAAAQVPPVPAEAVSQIWIAAWTAAQASTMARSEKLAAERDAALLELETMSQDLADQVRALDEQSTRLDQAAEVAVVVQAAHLEDIAKLEAEHLETKNQLDDSKQQMQRNKMNMEKVQTDAAHAAQIAEAGRDLMRQELARLTDQLGELKAALYKRAEIQIPPAP